MGVAPWQRWTDTPTPFMREYFFRWAWVAEQAELSVEAEQVNPDAKYARFIEAGQFVGKARAERDAKLKRAN